MPALCDGARGERAVTLPLRLDVERLSAVRARLVASRGTKVVAELGTWTPLRGWDLTAAGCAAPRLLRVLPAVMDRAAARHEERWLPEALVLPVSAANGCRQAARTWTA